MIIIDILLKKVRYIMKKFLISTVAIGAILFTGCSSEHTIAHIRNYKISFVPDKELPKDKCFSAGGKLMIYDSDIIGELKNSKEETTYLKGTFDRKTLEVVIYVLNGKNQLIANVGGDLNAISGGGDWVGVDCYGKWMAKREDKQNGI